MEKWQKDYITVNSPKLLELIDGNTTVLACLRAGGTISAADEDALTTTEKSHGKRNMAYSLIHMLETRTRGYEQIITALHETRQTGAVEILLQGFLDQGITNVLEQCEVSLEFEAQSNPQNLVDPYMKNLLLWKEAYFQGKNDTIKNILAKNGISDFSTFLNQSLDQEMLEYLSTNPKKVVLSLNTIPNKLSYYVKRTLSPRSRLHQDIFRALSEDVFIFKNMTRAELSAFVHPNRTEVSGAQLDGITVRFILLEIEADVEFLFKISESPIHVIWHEQGEYHWQQSRGNISLLHDYISEEQKQISDDQFVSDFIDNGCKAICISDTPGIWKTKLLEEIARLVKQSRPNRIVLFFPLQELVNELSKSDKLSTETIFNLFAQKGASNKMGRNLLHKILSEQTKKVEVFLDGYDEINIDQFPIANILLKLLKETKGGVRIFVTTRPHLRNSLEEALGVLGYNILPFRPTDQVNFLVDYWKSEIGDIYEHHVFEKFASCCLETLKVGMNDFERDVAGVPLQCMLLADIYADKIPRYALSNRHLPENLMILSLFEMYKELIRIRFIRVEDEEQRIEKKTYTIRKIAHKIRGKRKWKQRVFEYHVYSSLKLLFPNTAKNFESLLLSKSKLDPCFHTSAIGIFEEKTVNDPNPRFLHRTFAEYLVSEFIIKILVNSPDISWRIDWWRKTIEKFLHDEILSTTSYTESPLHTNCFGFERMIKTASFKNSVIAYFLNEKMKEIKMEEIQVPVISHALELYKGPISVEEDTFYPILLACVVGNYKFLAKYAQLICVPHEECSRDLMMLAAKHSNADMMQSLMDTGFAEYGNIGSNQFVGEEGWGSINPFHVAVQRGDFSTVEFCRVQASSSDLPRYLLHYCVRNSRKDRADVVSAKKQIITALSHKNERLLDEVHLDDGSTPILQPNIHLDLFRHLVRSGADINYVTKNGDTILHTILRNTNDFPVISLGEFVEILKLVLQNGFTKLSHRSTMNQTSLHVLLSRMDVDNDILQIFKETTEDFLESYDHENTLILKSIENGRSLRTIRSLIQYGFSCHGTDEHGQNLLHKCVKVGNLELLNEFISHPSVSFSVNCTDKNGNTPLHLVFDQASNVNEKLLTVLLKNGASPNVQNKQQNTPLFYGLEIGTITIPSINLLLKHIKQVPQEVASRGLYFLMVHNRIRVDVMFREIFLFFMEMGGKVILKSGPQPLNVHEIYKDISEVVSHLTAETLDQEMELGQKVSLKLWKVGKDLLELQEKGLKSFGFERLCLLLLDLPQNSYFLKVQHLIQSFEIPDTELKFILPPPHVQNFISTQDKRVIIIKTLDPSICIARIHENINPNISVVDAEYFFDLETKPPIIIINGYNKNIRNYAYSSQGAHIKIICIVLGDIEIEASINTLCIDDTIKWSDVSSSYQHQLESFMTSEERRNRITLKDKKVINLINRQGQPIDMLLSNYVHVRLCHIVNYNQVIRDEEHCTKLISLALAQLFPSFANLFRINHSSCDDLNILVKSGILVRVEDKIPATYGFATLSTAWYFAAFAVNGSMRQTEETSKLLLSHILLHIDKHVNFEKIWRSRKHKIFDDIYNFPGVRFLSSLCEAKVETNFHYLYHIQKLSFREAHNDSKDFYFREALETAFLGFLRLYILFPSIKIATENSMNLDWVSFLLTWLEKNSYNDAVTKTSISKSNLKYFRFFDFDYSACTKKETFQNSTEVADTTTDKNFNLSCIHKEYENEYEKWESRITNLRSTPFYISSD